MRRVCAPASDRLYAHAWSAVVKSSSIQIRAWPSLTRSATVSHFHSDALDQVNHAGPAFQLKCGDHRLLCHPAHGACMLCNSVPRPPPGVAGIFLCPCRGEIWYHCAMPPARVVVFIDYENVHRSALESFWPAGTGRSRGHIDPVKVGRLLVARRTSNGLPSALAGGRVYRGRPNPSRQATAAAANDRQADEWACSPLVTVKRRPLRRATREPAAATPVPATRSRS